MCGSLVVRSGLATLLLSARDGGHQRGAATAAVFRQHQVKRDARPDQRGDLLRHERVEVRVEAVHGAVDAHSDSGLVHLVDQRRYACGDQVRGAPGHAFADVPDRRHVGFCRVG